VKRYFAPGDICANIARKNGSHIGSDMTSTLASKG
jgi:hypothetical protein